jgi:hypothetical protein
MLVFNLIHNCRQCQEWFLFHRNVKYEIKSAPVKFFKECRTVWAYFQMWTISTVIPLDCLVPNCWCNTVYGNIMYIRDLRFSWQQILKLQFSGCHILNDDNLSILENPFLSTVDFCLSTFVSTVVPLDCTWDSKPIKRATHDKLNKFANHFHWQFPCKYMQTVPHFIYIYIYIYIILSYVLLSGLHKSCVSSFTRM